MGPLPPLRAGDLQRLAIPWQVALSPDGARLGHVVRVAPRRPGPDRARLRIGAAAGGRPFWTTDGSHPVWLDDQRLAFRAGAGLALWDARRGQSRIAMPGDLTRPTPLGASPDGRYLAFSASSPPAPRARPRVWEVTRIRYKSDGQGLWRGGVRGLYVADLETGPDPGIRALGPADVDVSEAVWAGDRILACGASIEQSDRHNRLQLFAVDLDGRWQALTDAALTAHAPCPLGPDAVAFLGHDDRYGEGTHLTVKVLRRTTGAVVSPAGPDATFADMLLDDLRPAGGPLPIAAWPDGRGLWAVSTEHGESVVRSLALEADRLRTVWRFSSGGHLSALALAPQAARAAWVYSDPVEPGRIDGATLDPYVPPAVRTSHVFNRWLSKRFVAAPEAVNRRPGEEAVEGWLMRPREAPSGGRGSLILMIHGGPHAAFGRAFSFEGQVLAGAGHAVAYANPAGSMGGGQALAIANRGDWGGVDRDQLVAFVDDAALQYGGATPRIGVCGGSYGGYMTLWLAATTDRFQAAAADRCVSSFVSHFGMSGHAYRGNASEFAGPFWRDADRMWARSPLSRVADVRCPVLLLHGEEDHRAPIGEAEQFYLAMRLCGLPARLVRFAAADHDLTRTGPRDQRVARLELLAEFWAEHLTTRHAE